ncbi:hypothetical protein PVAP13_5KG193228, partial [Panicum virgatum]
MGPNSAVYEKKSYSDTFTEFYQVFGHENDHKAPSFVEVEKWLSGEGKNSIDDKWLKIWLMFAISTFLCPTSSPKLCVRAFHSISITEEIKGYNWCKLEVDRLIKGIAKFKSGKRKFVSGCLFFLTILYLDSLDVGDIVNNDLEVRAAAWTGQLVSKVCLMDKLSETQFGKLQLKPEHLRTTMIPPERIQQFIDSNMPESVIVVLHNREVLKSALSEFSIAINQVFVNLTQKLC